MKRLICTILALCLLAALPLTAFAAESGTCGEGITWTLDGTTLTVSGSGKMSDNAEGAEPWAEYKDTITAVKFTGGVTYVGAYAFKDYDKITSVSFDAKTEELGTGAFQGCDGLTKLTVPFTGKFIMGEDSLRGCKNLKTIEFSGRFPKFKNNCLWDTYTTLIYPAESPWPADTIAELEKTFQGRIEFRGSDGTDPVVPTEPPKQTEPPAPKPTQAPQPVVTPTTETVTAPTWSVPDVTTEFTVPTFSMPEFTEPQDSENEPAEFSGWLAVVAVVGVLAAFAAVTIYVQQVQRRNRRKKRRQRPNFQ